MTTSLYDHQKTGIMFLAAHRSAMLADEMGLGKSRQALIAASRLFALRKIDRVLVLCPSAVRFAWGEEIGKLLVSGEKINLVLYNAAKQAFYYTPPSLPKGDVGIGGMPVCCASYGLLPQQRHVDTLNQWLSGGDALLVCDESSFLKNRTAKQSKGALSLAASSAYRWLLTGTPIANSPIDLYMQGKVMSPNGSGPLAGINNFYSFRAKYFVMGGFKQKQAFANEQKLPELTKRFAPFVLRREKKDCLDLPEKTYTVREVALNADTWRIYQELKREALLCLPDSDAKPEPNAAVRILRLCQLTSGHVGSVLNGQDIRVGVEDDNQHNLTTDVCDVSSEKLDYLADSIVSGELSSERALIVWCRWRRERERLFNILCECKRLYIYQVYGSQSQKDRNFALNGFQVPNIGASYRNVLLAQPHAGGFGLNLTQASTAIYLSNDFSFTTRVQSEDRIHRIGQKHACLYIDILATGPKNERTVDHHIAAALRAKKDLAALTCNAWRSVLSE